MVDVKRVESLAREIAEELIKHNNGEIQPGTKARKLLLDMKELCTSVRSEVLEQQKKAKQDRKEAKLASLEAKKVKPRKKVPDPDPDELN